MDKQWVEVELAPVVVPVPAAGLEPEAVAPERTRALGDAFELLTAQRSRREQTVSSSQRDAHQARATKRSRATRPRLLMTRRILAESVENREPESISGRPR
jgi:hypothetical protein